MCLYRFAKSLFSIQMRETSAILTVEYKYRKDFIDLGLAIFVSRQLELTGDAAEHSIRYNAPGWLLAVLKMN